jgi:hypothetical protein
MFMGFVLHFQLHIHGSTPIYYRIHLISPICLGYLKNCHYQDFLGITHAQVKRHFLFLYHLQPKTKQDIYDHM